MEQDEQARSRERVRTLAEVVSVQIDDERLDALAVSLDDALARLEDLGDLVAGVDLPVSEPYDAAWQGGGNGR